MKTKVSTETHRVAIAGTHTGAILRLLLGESLSAVALYEHMRKKDDVTQAGVYHAIQALLRFRFILPDEPLATMADADRFLAKVMDRMEKRGVRGSPTIYRLTETGRIAAMTLDMEAAAERNRPSRLAALRQGILTGLIALRAEPARVVKVPAATKTKAKAKITAV